MADTVQVGLDHIAVYAPDQYLDLTDLAVARDVDPDKYLVGIGIKEAAVAAPSQDVAVLAANAGHAVLTEAGVLPEEVGFLVVGTESAVDKSKPTATHVHELLGISPQCRVYDIMHACVGATYGLLSALDWLHRTDARYALVIASDIARYGKGSLGEPTQGAGAVAMLLCREPRLMVLEEINTYSRQVWDFWKPLNETYPIVDGMYSTQCYIEAVTACYSGIERIEREAAFLYHMPYPKLVQQAHGRIARLIDKEVKWKEHFAEWVEASCHYPSRIGNIYTGSLWLSLVSQLESRWWSDGRTADPDLFYLFSYGSGSGAALLRGQRQPTWTEVMTSARVETALATRRRLSMEDYESSIVDYDGGVTEGSLPDPAHGRFRLDRVEDDKRVYVEREDA